MTRAKATGAAARSTQQRYSHAGIEVEQRPFGEVLRDLLLANGYVTGIGNPDWMTFSKQLDHVSYESLRKAVVGDRQPGVKIMEACAETLGVKPEVFWEYSLAQVQRSFDPKEVGSKEAFANLAAWFELQRDGEKSE